MTNSDARISVLYLHVFLCFHWGQGNVSWFLLRMWNMGQFPLCFGSMWSTSIFPISSFSNNCKKRNRKKGLYFEMVRLNLWYRQVTFPFCQSLIIEYLQPGLLSFSNYICSGWTRSWKNKKVRTLIIPESIQNSPQASWLTGYVRGKKTTC